MKLKLNSEATISKGIFVGKKEAAFHEKNTLPTVMGVDPSCFGIVLQPVAPETLQTQREELIPLNTNKFWKQKSHCTKVEA